VSERRRILFICGTLNQTTQMHQVARELPEHEHAFTPYYCDGALDWAHRAGFGEFTVAGKKLVRRCLDYLERERLPVDYRGRQGTYDLVVTCSDVIVQRNARATRLVLVQEGILDPEGWEYRLWRRFPLLPRFLAGTAATGLSHAYDRFCVASGGYRDHFVSRGVPPERVAVTGIPNFDDCRRYLENDFPHRRCVEIAAGRPLVFKLHPNENEARATREIHAVAPSALVFARGSAEAMIANCDALVTQYSSTVFVGLALGKECHSYWDLAQLRRLLPEQNGCAARKIATVCREVVATSRAGARLPRFRPLAVAEAR